MEFLVANRICIPYKDVVFAINTTKIAGKFYIEVFDSLCGTLSPDSVGIGELLDELDITATYSTGLWLTEKELQRWYDMVCVI